MREQVRELAELRQKVIELEASAKKSKENEEEVRKREEGFRTLVRALAENSPDIIERFDRQARHIYVNPMAAKLHGMPAEAFIGKTSREIGVPEHYCRFWGERIEKVFETGQAIEEENEFPTIGGIRIYQYRFVAEKGGGTGLSLPCS